LLRWQQLYIDIWLCNNGAVFKAPLSIGDIEITTWELGFMRFVLTLMFAVATIFSAAVQADAASGQSAYASRGCIGCHGAGGISVVATNPTLKGKSGDYIRKNLADFRSGARKNPIMNTMAAGLSDADIENLGDYIESLK
jgi:cytochrome c553